MNTATITSTTVTTDSAFRRALRAFLTGLRASLEFTGRAYLHGARPL
jgi:hypothetical protein